MPLTNNLGGLNFLNFDSQTQDVDPYQKLQELIGGINNQPLPVAPQMGTLERILTSIAQAASVAASNDPGTALANQLKAKADSRNAVTQAIQNRQNLVNQATLQAGFQQAEGMAREQAEVRKERRQFKQKAIENIQEVNLFKNKKQIESDIQLQANKSLLEQNLKFEVDNKDIRNALALNKATLDLLPEKYREAAKWEAEAKLLVPNIDESLLHSVAKKKSGFDNTPITTKESELIVAINKASFDRAQEQLGLSKRKIEADIQESKDRGKAALIGADAAMRQARNQEYNSRIDTWARQRQVDILQTQFYKTPNGAIIPIEEVNKLPINEKFAVLALPAAENVAHQQKLIMQMNDTINKSKMDTDTVNQQLQKADDLTNQIKEDLKTKTPEQVKQQILNSNLPQSEKNRAMEVLGEKPKTQAPNQVVGFPNPLKVVGGLLDSVIENTGFTGSGRIETPTTKKIKARQTVAFLENELRLIDKNLGLTPNDSTMQEKKKDIESRLRIAKASLNNLK